MIMIVVMIVAQSYYYWWIHTYCNGTMCPSYINYRLERRCFVASYVCSTHYTAVQITNCLKRTSAAKVVTMKITDDFHYEWKPSRAYHTFHDEQRWMVHKEDTVKSIKNALYCMYSGMAKSTSQAEATSNSKIIKLIALAIVELCESEGIRQAGS